MRTDLGTEVKRLKDYRPTPYAIATVEQTFRLHPSATEVTTTLRCERREGARAGEALVLDGDELTFVSATLDGEPLADGRFEATPDRFTLNDPSERFSLTVTTRVSPEANTKLMGLYRSRGTYCTQCEAEGFRRIAYMYDRPDVLAVYTTRIEAPGGEPVLLGNGDPVEEGELEGGGRFAVWHDPHPKPAYLFALVAGDLGHIERGFTTMGGREVRCRVYVEHGNEDRAEWAMDSLIRSMKWDEERFGREYDLDVFNIVAVSDFNMGAMENKGLNVFNDKLVLASPETATDADYARIEAVVAHEYFHNWTGNRITCRDWFQLCLKEGLTVYRDHEFQADMRDRDVRRIDEVRMLRALQFPEDQGPLRHKVRPTEFVEINNFYTATIYEKGSELVRMIATLLGRDAFRAGMDLYFDRHDGEACTIEQFVTCFEEAGDTDLDQFMRWYSQPGTPTIRLSIAEDGGDLRVALAQSQPPAPDGTESEPLVVPLAFENVGADGTLRAEEGCRVERADGDGKGLVVLTDREASLRIEGGAGGRPWPVAGFSAPVVLEMDGAPLDRWLETVAARAADPFARWDAMNSLLLGELAERGRATASDDNGTGRTDKVVAALHGSIADDALSPAFRAELLKLPGEAEIARRIGEDVDPDAVHAARGALKARICETCSDTMLGLYDEMRVAEPFEPNAEQGGRRALRNAVLMVMSEAEGAAGRAKRQFDEATNMTDTLAALTALVTARPAAKDGTAPEADEALAAFAERFGDNPLVMDKWLGVQAGVPGAGTLDRVIALEGHPAYDAGNPNRVRALWGAFAANQTGFHRADGRGYEVFAARLATFDAANPQLSARMATAFRTHRQLETTRRELARNALNSLRERSNLSVDLLDIIERTLSV